MKRTRKNYSPEFKAKEVLEKNGIKISMNAKGRSIDNIVIERFLQNIEI